MRLLICLFICAVASAVFAKETPPPPECNIKPTQAVTTPAPVEIRQLIQNLSDLKTQNGRKMLDAAALKSDLGEIFNAQKPNSKLQQFYRLLYIIAKNSQVDIGVGLDFDVEGARRILVTAMVFPNPAFPAHITGIHLVSTSGIPEYTVTFDVPVNFPLNQGKGFRSWDDGYCQHAKELVFAESFKFRTRELTNGNLKVYRFQGVDLFGDFGTRGTVDVTLQYVRLAEVEFIRNSNLGKVKAFISRKEFEESRHSRILRLVSQIIPNTSLQAIDW